MTYAIRWWLTAPMSGAKATALVLGVWLAIAALVSMPGIGTH